MEILLIHLSLTDELHERLKTTRPKGEANEQSHHTLWKFPHSSLMTQEETKA